MAVKYTEHDEDPEDNRPMDLPNLKPVEHPTPMELAASTPGTLPHALFSDDWEKSHLPMDDLFAVLPPMRCDECGTMGAELSVTKFNGIDDVTLHFCGEACAQKWYVQHLRESGGL